MKQRKPVAPAPPECPVCTTPHMCGTSEWQAKRGPRCQGKAAGIDECDCLNYCGDDPWLKDGRARGCSKFYTHIEKPQTIFPRVIVMGGLIVGPFTPLPYDL